MLSEIQRVILGDALDCLEFIKEASELANPTSRRTELDELLARATDDIKTVFRADRVDSNEGHSVKA